MGPQAQSIRPNGLFHLEEKDEFMKYGRDKSGVLGY